MGHQRMMGLPTSRPWRDVVAALAGDAAVDAIAAAASEAADEAFQIAARSDALADIVELLARLPLAARHPDYLGQLRDLGLTVDAAPTLLDLSTGLMETLDQRARHRRDWTTSDIGELGRLAAVESLTSLVEPQLPGLFGADPADVRTALGRFASGDRFGELARTFFSRFLYRTLDYYLSRNLAEHMGPGKRFAGLADRRAFEAALATHCRETTAIVGSYSSGWYGKQAYQKDDLSRSVIRRYVEYSFEKLMAELRVRRDA